MEDDYIISDCPGKSRYNDAWGDGRWLYHLTAQVKVDTMILGEMEDDYIIFDSPVKCQYNDAWGDGRWLYHLWLPR